MADYRIRFILEGEDRASGALGRVGGALGGLGSVAGGILAAQVFTGIASGIQSMATQALDSIATFERMELSIGALAAREAVRTGQAADMQQALQMTSERAEELVGWLQQVAIKSPFTLEGTQRAFQTALAYGFSTQEAQRLTQAMIDFATVSPQGEQAMSSIGLALGQIRARGRLAGQEVLQLVNAGIPVLETLSRKFGVTTQEVSRMMERGQIDAATAIEAIVSSLEEDFGGAAERQATSWAGLMNTFSDLKKLGLKELFEGIADAIQPFVAGFSEWLQGPGLELLGRWGEGIGTFVGNAITGIQGLIDLFSDFDPTAIGDVFGEGKVGQGVTDILQGVQDLGAAFQEHWPAMRAAAEQFVSWFQTNVVPQLGQALSNIGLFLQTLGAWWSENGPAVIATLSTVARVFSVTIAGAINIVTGLITALFQLFQTGPEAAIATLEGTFRTFFDSAASIVGSNWETFKATWVNNWDMLKIIVNKGVGRLLAPLANGIIKFVNAGRAIVDGVKRGIENAWSGLVAWFNDKVAALTQGIRGLLRIDSPSQVFFDIGRQMVTGWAQGIAGAMPMPAMAMAGVAGGTIAASTYDYRRSMTVHELNVYDATSRQELRGYFREYLEGRL